MSERSSASSGGIGVVGLLGIVFIVMKLAGIGAVADWSWWWVLSPFWIGLALAIFVIICVFAAIALKEARRSSRR